MSDYLAKGTLSALKRSALCEILNFYLDHSRPKNNHHQENFEKILSIFYYICTHLFLEIWKIILNWIGENLPRALCDTFVSYSDAISNDKLAVAVECEELAQLCLTVSNQVFQRSLLGLESELELKFSTDLIQAIGDNLMSIFLVSGWQKMVILL